MPTVYNATIKLDIPQLVQCRHCDAEYVYEMTVTGYGGAETALFFGKDAARQAAEGGALEDLASRMTNLDTLFNAVPCPECFRYQPYMSRSVSQQRYILVTVLGSLGHILGLFTAVGGAIAWLASPENRPIALPVGAVGLVVGAVGYAVARFALFKEAKYDPNEHDPAGRQELAGARAMPPAAYEELQATRLRAAYNEHLSAGEVPEARSGRPDPDAPQARVFEWWVKQAFLTDGGAIVVALSDSETATVRVPEDTESETVFDLDIGGRPVEGFKVRVSAVYVHKDEMRLE